MYCIYVYVCIYTCMYVHTDIHTPMCIYVYIYIQYIYIFLFIHYVYIYIYTRCICTYLYPYVLLLFLYICFSFQLCLSEEIVFNGRRLIQLLETNILTKYSLPWKYTNRKGHKCMHIYIHNKYIYVNICICAYINRHPYAVNLWICL